MSSFSQIINSFLRFISSIFSRPKPIQQTETKAKHHKPVTEEIKEDRDKDKDVNHEATTDIEEDVYTEDSTPQNETIDIEEQERITMEDLLEYLTQTESYTIHYNKGEIGKTAPTGIYYKYYSDWEGWSFLTQIAQEYDIEFDPSESNDIGCKELTQKVCTNYKDTLDAQIYDFTQAEYFNKLHLNSFPGKKSALSYFSITVNGGKHRSAKILQKVLVKHGASIKIDGKAGKKTYRALEECGLDDEYLNQQILLQVYNFYNYLIGRNPEKYTLFYNGWINRLKKLGFIVP